MKYTIEAGTYEGYIWKSDQGRPEVFDGKITDAIELNDDENPFIIEAQLYDIVKEVSYSIKYVDGEYKVKKYELSNLENQPSRVHLYYPNRMSELSKETRLMFAQYWKTEPDDLCEGMETLRPDKLVFIGFERKEDEI